VGEELLLTLDSSTSAGSIAVSRGERLLGEVLTDSDVTHGDRLLLQVEQLLTDLRLDLSTLSAVAVVDGPGSFTGLRVGVATAKGLATACRKPLIGVSSLETLAAGLPYCRLPVCALLDARKKEVYTATFSTAHGFPETQGEARAIPPGKLLEEISEPTLFAGSGAIAYAALIRDRLGSLAHFPLWGHHTPRSSCAAAVALQRFRAGVSAPPGVLLPRYLRPSEAELNLPQLHP